ncbi:tRNA pseudouridine55 synthase [Marisediminicola sp. UYEF4]|uniref:tRNA pseudouridine(55) synthase TruB n=1 Tax=Marisediminicola sp. UYEF4 TaxID=1756384 RepID=UPI003390FEDF
MSGTSGILLVDKTAGITSHDAVSRTRKRAGTKKVGHAGTLDPMATGLLVLGINSSTRLLTYVVGLDKEYLATIRLGASTVTDDREGDRLDQASTEDIDAVTPEAVVAEIAKLTGAIEQVPSTVSAIKVDGKRAYALVRAGETVELRSRAVTVSAFELLGTRRVAGGAAPGTDTTDSTSTSTADTADTTYLDLDVRVECSSGTYIRALARDLGAALGVGGHLTALRRTRIGPFRVEDAADLATMVVADHLLSPADAAAALFPTIALDAQQAIDLTHGKRIRFADTADAAPVAALAPGGRLVGLLTIDSGVGRPLVNFPTDEVTA